MTYRTIFFGTPEFSVPFLKALINGAGFDVVGVATTPDRKSGRGQKLKQSPVAEYVNQYNSNLRKYANDTNRLPRFARNDIKLFKPKKILNLKSEILNLQPQVAVLVAYGKIIPQEIIDLFPKGIINIHPSLLPKYRGPDPLRAAILNGDDKTGISIMKLDKKMDHGPIINQIEINITENDDLGDLYKKVIKIGPDFLVKTLKLYLEGKLKLKEQNHKNATYCKMIIKKDAQINWDQSPQKIDRHIKAFNPIPETYTDFNKKILKILQSHLKNGKLIIDRVKPENKKQMSWKSFINGYRGKIPSKIIDKIVL